MPIQGYTRHRLNTFGLQSAFGTAEDPTRAVAWRGIPEINPNWTDQDDVDVGSIDTVLPPYRTQTDITSTFTGSLTFQDVPLLMAGGLIGGVTPTGGGAAKTWAFEAVSLTATELDYFTNEFSDDVVSDGIRVRDMIFASWELSFDESLGPWQLSANALGGYVDTHITQGRLPVGSNLALVFGADTELFIDDAAGGIGGTKIEDALHSMTISHEYEIDQKRFANGSNSRFALAGYGITKRNLTASFVFAKTPDIVAALNSETVDWLNADPVNRFVKVLVTSPTFVTGSTAHTLDIRLSGTWRTRSDGDQGGNSTVTLELMGRYDSNLGYPIRVEVVNSLAALP